MELFYVFLEFFSTFHIIHHFFRLFTLFAAPAIKLKLRSDVSGNKKEEIGTTLLQADISL
jgi:hypothetical protein